MDTSLILSVLSPPLLLLLLLPSPALSVSGSVLNPAPDVTCPANVTIYETEGPSKIEAVREHGRNIHYYKTFQTYLHPEPGFKGVGLEAVVNGSKYTAWFPLQDTCFPEDDSVYWWKVWAGAWVLTYNKTYAIVFQLNTGMCNNLCAQTVQSNYPSSLHIVAHGPSGWRRDKREGQRNCNTREELKGSLQVSHCTPSDKTTPNDHTTTASAPITAPATATLSPSSTENTTASTGLVLWAVLVVAVWY